MTATHPDPQLPHLASLAPASLDLARKLGAYAWAEDFYLAGSASLALYVGHREVANLDLMTAHNRLAGTDRRDLLAELKAIDPDSKVETARDGFMHIRVAGVALKFFYYPYPLTDPVRYLDDLAVVSPVDLGLMKLGAIIGRGTRRDFVDLYLLCRHLPFADLLERSADKYGHVRDFPVQALKSLADLTLIDGEPMPPLAESLEWSVVEQWLESQVREHGAQLLAPEPDSPQGD